MKPQDWHEINTEAKGLTAYISQVTEKNVGVPFMEPVGLINQAPTKIKKGTFL